MLCFDQYNIRYISSTVIGEWARDKNARFALLMRGAEPILWDFGSAARHHQLYAPWLPVESFRAGVTPMRGAMPDETLERVEEHLAMCDWCRDYLRQIEATAQAVGAEAAASGTAPADETLQARVGAFRARTRGGRER